MHDYLGGDITILTPRGNVAQGQKTADYSFRGLLFDRKTGTGSLKTSLEEGLEQTFTPTWVLEGEKPVRQKVGGLLIEFNPAPEAEMKKTAKLLDDISSKIHQNQNTAPITVIIKTGNRKLAIYRVEKIKK